MKNFNQLTEEDKSDCCQSLVSSLQMTINVYVHSNEIEMTIGAVLDSLMMLVAVGLADQEQEAKQEYISCAIASLRKMTNTELT